MGAVQPGTRPAIGPRPIAWFNPPARTRHHPGEEEGLSGRRVLPLLEQSQWAAISPYLGLSLHCPDMFQYAPILF